MPTFTASHTSHTGYTPSQSGEGTRLAIEGGNIEVYLPAPTPGAEPTVGLTTSYAIVNVTGIIANALATTADWEAVGDGTFRYLGPGGTFKVDSRSSVSFSSPNNQVDSQLWVNGAQAPSTPPAVYQTSASSIGSIVFGGTVTLATNDVVGFAFKAAAIGDLKFYSSSSSGIEVVVQ